MRARCPTCKTKAPPRLDADLALHDCKTGEWNTIRITDAAIDYLRVSGRGDVADRIEAGRRRRIGGN